MKLSSRKKSMFMSTKWVLVLYLGDKSSDHRNINVSQGGISIWQQPFNQVIFTTAYTLVTTSSYASIFRLGTHQSEITFPHLYCIQHCKRFSASSFCSDNWITSTLSTHLFPTILLATGSASRVWLHEMLSSAWVRQCECLNFKPVFFFSPHLKWGSPSKWLLRGFHARDTELAYKNQKYPGKKDI